jgi:hypothetical protein
MGVPLFLHVLPQPAGSCGAKVFQIYLLAVFLILIILFLNWYKHPNNSHDSGEIIWKKSLQKPDLFVQTIAATSDNGIVLAGSDHKKQLFVVRP